ncbi:glycerophosphodiester phosphodiesterase family protein [Arvimicrobium flavum]|uniref:glycerophosphodiester phosphodiesterase family protein n=1 Tax=Arvimicrobium flavum TaxID=3393320 RepID=UPI00237B5E99|nr:glycerophosphodiester phosphodiesterase family protein [Mesorhizobium shangrilense]
MRNLAIGALLGAFLVLPGQAAEATRTEQILGRFGNANDWRDHVMVVAHRGGGLMSGKSRFPENSRAAVEASIRMGAEMVELDVQKTSDGIHVVFHDSWLDRTTTCSGRLDERTFDQLRSCRLVVEATGQATAEPVPTLREMLEIARGRILVNIDNKLGFEELGGMVDAARQLGMAEQVIIKQNLWSAEKVAEARALVSGFGDAQFMPIIADDAVRDVGFLESATDAVDARAVEMINWRDGAQKLTQDGGVLFSTRARAVAARGNWHLWVNTYAIVNKAGGYLAGGRGDELAVAAGMPAETYGFWADRGATIIQTDEPEAAILWLDANGYRVPYAVDQVEAAIDLSQ